MIAPTSPLTRTTPRENLTHLIAMWQNCALPADLAWDAWRALVRIYHWQTSQEMIP